RRRSRIRGRDREQFLAHVDADRAPRDAPATADATGGPEWSPPGRELVRQPLPIPVGNAGTEVVVTCDPSEAEREAAVPRPFTLAGDPIEVGRHRHARAEAGRTNEGAVRTSEAPFGDAVPRGGVV